MHGTMRRILILALLALPFGAHAAETWQKLNKNNWNNAFQNQPAAVTNLTTGSQLWTSRHWDLFSGAGIIIAGGSAISVKQEGGMTWGDTSDDHIALVSIRAETGGRYWESKPLAVGNAVDWWSSSTPTYDPAENALYIGTSDVIQKISPATGDIVTSTRLSAATTGNTAGTYEIINSSPVVGGNLMFIETYGGNNWHDKQLVALNKSTLAKAWAVKDGGIGNGSPCYVDNGATKRVYTAIKNGVACYDAPTGALVWKSSDLPTSWSLTFDVAASLVYDNGNLYVTSNDLQFWTGMGEIDCVDAATGAPKWSAPQMIGWVSVPPVVLNGRVYVKGGNSMHLWCFDAATGTQIFDKAIGGSSFATCLAATPTRIYTTNGSKLLTLDPATGNVLTAVGDDYYDGPITLDEFGAVYAHAGDTLRAFGRTVPVGLSRFHAE